MKKSDGVRYQWRSLVYARNNPQGKVQTPEDLEAVQWPMTTNHGDDDDDDDENAVKNQ